MRERKGERGWLGWAGSGGGLKVEKGKVGEERKRLKENGFRPNSHFWIFLCFIDYRNLVNGIRLLKNSK